MSPTTSPSVQISSAHESRSPIQEAPREATSQGLTLVPNTQVPPVSQEYRTQGNASRRNASRTGLKGWPQEVQEPQRASGSSQWLNHDSRYRSPSPARPQTQGTQDKIPRTVGGVLKGQDEPGGFTTDLIQPVKQVENHVVLQVDFKDFERLTDSNSEDFLMSSLRDTLPESLVYESWIKYHFGQNQVRDCSTTIQGLPMTHRGVALTEIMDTMLTLNQDLPRHHRGALAVKIHVNHDNEFSGQVWILWSNTRLARGFIRVFQGLRMWNSPPFTAEISRDSFKFTPPGLDWAKPRYGDQTWTY